MKKLVLQGFAFLLAISLLTGMLPLFSSASDDELVLTKIGHTSSDIVSLTDAATRSVALTVPFTFTGNTLDLSVGLIVDKASSIDSVITSFSSASTASIGEPGAAGPPVNMTVSYYKGGNTANQNTTVYSISVVRAAKKNPTFTGTIAKSVTSVMPSVKINDIRFTAEDFTNLYTANDRGALTSVTITGSSLSCGSLKIGSGTAYTNYVSGRLINLSDIGRLVFDATGSGTVSYIVSAYAGGDTAAAIGSVLLTITVNAITVPTITSSVVKSVNLGATLNLSLTDFSSCYSLNNGSPANIVIKPANSNYGTWYKGSKAFTGAKTFKSNDIGTLKFKGTLCGQAAFTWTVSNEKGTSAAGNGAITVNAVTTTINCTTGLNTAKTFTASDFNAACKDATGANLNYIYFSLPSASCGTLYYGYVSPSSPGTAITSNSVLYYGASPKISNVAFVPATNYTGTFALSYTGVNTSGISYAGDVKMIVGNAGDMAYFTAQNTNRTFTASDFNAACANVTGTGLSYVYFTLPSSSYGALYYGYSSPSYPGTAVTSNSPYALQDLSFITFVPAANYTGTISIPYTGVAVNSVSYTGYINLTVGGQI